MNCSLIICTFNWPEALKLVLDSANSQSTLPDEIIIADDGSEVSTSKVINDFSNKASVPVIHSWQENKGCRIPHSRNRAIAKSNFEYIIMVDGDTILHRDFVKDHLRFAKRKVYLQGSRVLLQAKFTNFTLKENKFDISLISNKDVKNILNLIRFPALTALFSLFRSKNINRVRGCNYSIYKEDIFKVNGFNEDITTWGREDSEFVQRLFNNGVKKQLLKFSAVQYHLHHNQGSFNKENNSILKNTIAKKLTWCNSGIDRYLIMNNDYQK